MKQFPENIAQALMVILCSAGMFVSGCAKSHTSAAIIKKPDLDVLQGTWKMQTELRRKGMPSFTFNGTNMEYHGGITQVWYKATFTLRKDTTPKRLEAVLTACPSPRHVGQTFHAIYKIEDDKLTLTAYGPGDPSWPSNFDPGALVFLRN